MASLKHKINTEIFSHLGKGSIACLTWDLVILSRVNQIFSSVGALLNSKNKSLALNPDNNNYKIYFITHLINFTNYYGYIILQNG